MTTPATNPGNNNLHGTLRFLSKKYCPKRSSNSSQKLVRRARRGVPTIRKSLAARSDRLKVVSIVYDSKRDIVSAGNDSSSNEPKGPLSPETTVEPSPATANGASGPSAKSGEERKTSGTTTKLLHPEDLAQYKDAEAAQEEALRKIEMARQKVHRDQIQQVWGVYIYGLKHVLALNDLSNAPDAILPGNF